MKMENQIEKSLQYLSTPDGLLKFGESVARTSIRRHGHIDTSLFVVCEDHAEIVLPGPLDSEKNVEDFAEVARLICIRSGAKGAMLICHAWCTTVAPGEQAGANPADSANGQEIVWLHTETSDGSKFMRWPVMRSHDGKMIELGPGKIEESAKFQGGFGRLLPLKYPTPELRQIAKQTLISKGLLGVNADMPPMFSPN